MIRTRSSGLGSGRLAKEPSHHLDQLLWFVHVYVVAGLVDYLQLGIWQLLRNLILQLDVDEAIILAPYH